jgi:hypothetical protein
MPAQRVGQNWTILPVSWRRRPNSGLAHGAVIVALSNDDRSICGFAKNAAEFTDAEIAELAENVAALHALTADLLQLAPETVAQLRKMSIMVTHPES